MNKVYVWMRDPEAFLVVVAPTLLRARKELANNIGRPAWARSKRWDVGLERWVWNILASKPCVMQPNVIHTIFDIGRKHPSVVAARDKKKPKR
jgi:hypothetical protein